MEWSINHPAKLALIILLMSLDVKHRPSFAGERWNHLTKSFGVDDVIKMD